MTSNYRNIDSDSEVLCSDRDYSSSLSGSNGDCTASDSDTEEEILLLILALKKKRKYWIHDINKKRKSQGEYANLCTELMSYDDRFYGYFRMTITTFEKLHGLLKPHLIKQHTNWREPISSKERLVIFLRYLTTGDTFKTIANSFRAGNSTVSQIVHDVSEAIWNVLQPLHMRQRTEEDWKMIAQTFYDIWGFPNCLGSVDGKHVILKCPPNSGTMYYCYKKRYSLVLLAVVDAQYKFIYMDVGRYSKDSDSAIFERCKLYNLIKNNNLNIPSDKPLPGFTEPVPYVLIGDGGFKLEPFLMRPYAKEAILNDRKKNKFNKELSRARVVVECAFGIMAQKFRVFLRPFETDVRNTIKTVKAATCLHNFLQHEEGAWLYANESMDDTIRAFKATVIDRCRSGKSAFAIRKHFANYFDSV